MLNYKVPGKEVWQEIVMIDTVLYRVAVIPHDKSQKPAGGKLDGTDVKAYDQCACCLRKSVYVLEKLVPKPTCRSCSVLCQGGKCFAMRRNWIPISAFAGAWVKEQDYYFQLPKRNIAWGMVQLQTFAKKDVMIAGMDASALFEEHAKKLKITQCFADWQKNKADIEIAKKRLQNIPQECAGNEVLWKRVRLFVANNSHCLKSFGRLEKHVMQCPISCIVHSKTIQSTNRPSVENNWP